MQAYLVEEGGSIFLADSAPSQQKPYSIYHLSLTREGLLSLLYINMLIRSNFFKLRNLKLVCGWPDVLFI